VEIKMVNSKFINAIQSINPLEALQNRGLFQGYVSLFAYNLLKHAAKSQAIWLSWEGNKAAWKIGELIEEFNFSDPAPGNSFSRALYDIIQLEELSTYVSIVGKTEYMIKIIFIL